MIFEEDSHPYTLYCIKSGQLLANIMVQPSKLWTATADGQATLIGHFDFRNMWFNKASMSVEPRVDGKISVSDDLSEPGEEITITAPADAWMMYNNEIVQNPGTVILGKRHLRLTLVGKYKGEAHVVVEKPEKIAEAALMSEMLKAFKASDAGKALLASKKAMRKAAKGNLQ